MKYQFVNMLPLRQTEHDSLEGHVFLSLDCFEICSHLFIVANGNCLNTLMHVIYANGVCGLDLELGNKIHPLKASQENKIYFLSS